MNSFFFFCACFRSIYRSFSDLFFDFIHRMGERERESFASDDDDDKKDFAKMFTIDAD